MAAYVRLSGTPYYIGAALDTMPTSCLSGSRCYEYDTQIWYITYNSGTNWVAIDDSVPNTQAIADVEGTTSGAAVVTDANGTIQQYLRGLVTLAVSGINTAPAGWTFSPEAGDGTTVIKASAGILHGILVETDKVNDVTYQLFNHASANTNPMTPALVVAGGDNDGGFIGWDITFSIGCVLVLSGGTPVATVSYK